MRFIEEQKSKLENIAELSSKEISEMEVLTGLEKKRLYTLDKFKVRWGQAKGRMCLLSMADKLKVFESYDRNYGDLSTAARNFSMSYLTIKKIWKICGKEIKFRALYKNTFSPCGGRSTRSYPPVIKDWNPR